MATLPGTRISCTVNNHLGALATGFSVRSMITAAQVKELRERTGTTVYLAALRRSQNRYFLFFTLFEGAPMMDCKKALQDPEVDGNIEDAMLWLRKYDLACSCAGVALFCGGL